MEYIKLEDQKYYKDCKKLVEELSYSIVELHVVPQHTQIKVSIVITHKGNNNGIGINDCSKVHKLLLPFFEQVLNSEDIYMEVTSPGMERVLKNAAEFALFLGKDVKLWYTDISDWISGKIESCDEKSIILELTKGGEKKPFPYEKIAKAKLLYMEG